MDTSLVFGAIHGAASVVSIVKPAFGYIASAIAGVIVAAIRHRIQARANG